MRIDNNQRLLVGTPSAANAGASALIQVVHASGAGFVLAKNDTTVTSDELIGQILFSGNDSNGTYQTCAAIQCRSDGAHDTNDKPSTLVFRTTQDGGNSATERMRIDSSGRLLVGLNSAINAGGSSVFQIGTSIGAYVVVGRDDTELTDGSTIGGMRFFGNDSDGNYDECARIQVQADGTHTSTSKPSRLMFWTTADGAQSTTERMRIESNGDALIGTTNGNEYGLVDGRLNVVYPSTASASTHVIKAYHTNTSYSEGGGGLFFLATRRSANSGFNFGGWYTGNGTSSLTIDRQFQFRGDGNGYCDGSWTGGGADYAEYFEWSDGNTNAEDRRGISVVLDGNKIREAVAGEEPIGVVSGNPSIVGDAGWNKWVGKYLRDDFGTYIWEDYNPVDDDGNPKQDDDGNLIIQQRQKLNPDYNPDVEYINREDRSEWDAVGLMGKLRIRKGQVTGARWIKMRDISDNVEEWLVR
jgi:hypothetical protein